MINEKQSEIQEGVINKAIKFLESNKIGHINAAMRFGKMYCSLQIINKMYKITPSILIAYPDNKLKEGWQKEQEKWNIGKLDKTTYVNFSSLFKYIGYQFDLFIIDEWHDLSEKQLEYAKQISSSAFKTLGLSGTVSKETQERWLELKEIAKYTTNDGIQAGILANYQITVHLVDLDDKIVTKNKAGKAKTEKQRYAGYSWVISQKQRDREPYMHLALARNRLSLKSIGKIEYTKKLLKKLEDKRVVVFTGLSEVADSLGIPSYHSKNNDGGNFTDFQKGIINHLALAAMGKVGVTYSNLDSVILLNFTYNAEESSQILNRAIKLDYHGKIADLHVICLNENPEIVKVKQSLSMLDPSKIKYIT